MTALRSVVRSWLILLSSHPSWWLSSYESKLMTENMDQLEQNFGEYRLLRGLGGGGFGEVYLGEHVRNQTLAAIKVLHAQLADPVELKSFISEARTMRLKHPNIMPLLDFGIGVKDIPFLVMEYTPNGSLRTRHPRGWQLPLSTIMTYVHPIASALQYAHNVHLVHRNVKPENMLIGANNQILLADFGFATVAFDTYSSEGQNSKGGTIPYMAPEQFEGKAIPASDQYALAIVIYEWLSGAHPFTGTATEILLQHSQANPPSLCEKVPYLSRELEQVVMTALAKDPSQRFANVQDFVDALEIVGQTGHLPAVLSSNTATKLLAANEVATGKMPTPRAVSKPQPVEAATTTVLAQSGSDVPVVVAQTAPTASPKSVGMHSVLSKRKTITVAGLALTLLAIAFLLIGSFTSGARPGMKRTPILAISTTIIDETTVPSTAVPPITGKTTVPPITGKTSAPSSGKTAIPPIGKTVTPQATKAPQPTPKSTAPQPTPNPIVLQPTPTPTALPTPTPVVVLPTPTPTMPPTPTPTPHGVGSVQIDSGGSGTALFVGDEYFSNTTPGRPSSASNDPKNVVDTSGVSNPAPQSIYQSFRVGDCLYTIPHLTPYASYTVRLHFAELYWTQAGKRTFTVTLNGQVVLSNFDILATAGAANKAVVEQFTVQADSTGTITILFHTAKDNAQINAIEVLAA